MNKITHVLALGVFGIITTEFGIIGILPAISQNFEVSIDTAGLSISLFALVVAVFGPIMTLLISHFDKKKVVQFAILAFIISNILSATSESFYGLLFARVLPAFVLPIYFSNGLVIATNSVDKDKAMKAIATVYGGLSIATVVGIPMATYISEAYSWSASFYANAVINLISFIGVTFIVPSMRRSNGQSLLIQLNALKKKVLWLNTITVGLIAAGAFSVYSYFADYLKRIFEMNGNQVGTMLMVFGIAGIFGNWVAGLALSKNIIKTIVAYLTSMTLIFIALQHIGGNFFLQSLLIGIWGFFHMAGFIIGQVWINTATPDTPELANSLVVSTANLGIAVGTALGGLVIASFGLIQVLWVGILLSMASLILVVLNYKLFYKKN